MSLEQLLPAPAREALAHLAARSHAVLSTVLEPPPTRGPARLHPPVHHRRDRFVVRSAWPVRSCTASVRPEARCRPDFRRVRRGRLARRWQDHLVQDTSSWRCAQIWYHHFHGHQRGVFPCPWYFCQTPTHFCRLPGASTSALSARTISRARARSALHCRPCIACPPSCPAATRHPHVSAHCQ